MGLDMYLFRVREHNTAVDLDVSLEQKELVGQWRKANQIHNWFVQNVQNGKDDCGSYPVSHEQLQELFNLANAALKNPELGYKLLPTQEGFFFGSTEYDDDYIYDLELTIKIIKPLLEDDSSSALYEYIASW